MGMKYFISVGFLFLSACSSVDGVNSKPTALSEELPCESGFVRIYFEDESHVMDRLSANALNRFVRVKKLCQIDDFVVTGLNSPLNRGLDQQRSKAISDYLSLFGIAGVRFEPSSATSDAEIELSWQGRFLDRD